jgi:hypothetical protein
MGRKVSMHLKSTSHLPPLDDATVMVGPAIEAVTKTWARQAALSEQSLVRMGESLTRFSARTHSQGVQLLSGITAEHVRGFVYAALPDGSAPEIATLHARRTAIRAFYRAARALGLTDLDPTMDVFVPGRKSRATHPVTDEELLLLQTASLLKGDSRSAVVLALAEATAVTSEITHVRIRDVDDGEHPRTVKLAGTARHRPRLGQLTPWGSQVINRRIQQLQEGDADEMTLLAYGGLAPLGGAKAQASICNALGELIQSVGLDDQEGIRPGSIRAWAGRAIFESGGIAAAAIALGLSSLDQSAHVINYSWQSSASAEAK